jgi:hypothetical protein
MGDAYHPVAARPAEAVLNRGCELPRLTTAELRVMLLLTGQAEGEETFLPPSLVAGYPAEPRRAGSFRPGDSRGREVGG